MLEEAKTKHIVAPGINWLVATLHDAEAVSKGFKTRVSADDFSSDTHMRKPNK